METPLFGRTTFAEQAAAECGTASVTRASGKPSAFADVHC
jgi:hypothetical protein